jgi:hypothetical protein
MPPPSTSTQPTKLPSKKPQLTPRLISSSNRAQPSSASPLLSPHPNHTAIPFTNLGGPSPPPSAPASYSSGGGSVPRQLKGYNGFEEHSYGSPHGNSYPQYAVSPNSAVGGLASGLPGLTVAAGHHLARHASSNGHTGQVYEFATVNDAKGIEENVVCVAFEGGMEIWKVGRSAVEMVGRLEGMRGVVRGGKVC